MPGFHTVKLIKIRSKRLSRLLFFSRYLVVFMVVFASVVLTIVAGFSTTRAEKSTYLAYNFNSINTDNYIPVPNQEHYTKAEESLAVYRLEQAAIEARRKALSDKITRTLNYLKRQGSPVANEEIATMIVELAEDNNADYRVLLAIMTIESGSCRQSFAYNCFGYLNGVRYGSYPAAFQDLVPKVSRQYAARYGWDFVALSRAYGQHNWQLHSANMLKVANSI